MTEPRCTNSQFALDKLPARIENVRTARQKVNEWATNTAHLGQDATDLLLLLLSEIVTNAILAEIKQFPESNDPCRRIRVRVELTARSVVVSVFDFADGDPDLTRRPNHDAEGQRGLWIVLRMCHATISIERTPVKRGKTVVATMPLANGSPVAA
jgi:anti-sigma regulatory factor (Ser/Thr protein kinase)